MARRKNPRFNKSTPSGTTTEETPSNADVKVSATSDPPKDQEPSPEPNGSGPDSKPKSDADAGPEAGSKSKSDAEPKADPEATAEPHPETSSASPSDPVAKADAGSPAKTRRRRKTRAGASPKADADAKSEAEGAERSESKAGSEPRGATDTDGEPGADSEASSRGHDLPLGETQPAASFATAPVARPPGSSRQRAIRAALATLPVPEPGPSFWADLDGALSEQGHMAITARPAIRPISEPPPLSQPRLGDQLSPRTPAEGVSALGARVERELGGSSRRGNGSRRGTVIAVIAVLVGLLVVGTALGDDNEDPPPASSSTSTTLAEGEVTTTAPGPTSTTQPQVPGLEPEAPLTPGGVGPVQVGRTRRDLQQQGVETTVDEASFQNGEGRCFSGAVPAAPDLVLWFRSPNLDRGVGDSLDGVLAAVSVNTNEGSTRPTESALRLGAPQTQVLGIHEGQLDPVTGQAGEQVYVLDAPDGSDRGVAYVTDGAQLIKINVGFADVIPQPETCPA